MYSTVSPRLSHLHDACVPSESICTYSMLTYKTTHNISTHWAIVVSIFFFWALWNVHAFMDCALKIIYRNLRWKLHKKKGPNVFFYMQNGMLLRMTNKFKICWASGKSFCENFLPVSQLSVHWSVHRLYGKQLRLQCKNAGSFFFVFFYS